MKKRAAQPILGLVAPNAKPLTRSQQELVRRAGTYLSPGQQMTARRRARREEAEHEARKEVAKRVEQDTTDRPLRRLDVSAVLRAMRGEK